MVLEQKAKVLRLERAIQISYTVFAIAKSPSVTEYIIGYTSRRGFARRDEHFKHFRYEHFVILADGLKRDDALRLEGALQGLIKDVKNLAVYKKYEKNRRDGRHYPSFGRSASDPNAPVHAVYMAWKE